MQKRCSFMSKVLTPLCLAIIIYDSFLRIKSNFINSEKYVMLDFKKNCFACL